MKFGKHLLEHLDLEWDSHYIAYKALKQLIKLIEAELMRPSPIDPASVLTSNAKTLANDAFQPTLKQSSTMVPAGMIPNSRDTPHINQLKMNFFFRLERELEKVVDVSILLFYSCQGECVLLAERSRAGHATEEHQREKRNIIDQATTFRTGAFCLTRGTRSFSTRPR